MSSTASFCEEGGSCSIHPEAGSNDQSEHSSTEAHDQEIHTNNDSTSVQTKPKKQVKRRVSPKSSILTLHGQQNLDDLISSNSAVVVEFMTSWCGACKGIEEYYEELSLSQDEFGVKAARVVCDKNKNTKKLAATYNISSYPVFFSFKEGSVASRWEGADRGKLEGAFERLAGKQKKKKRDRNSKNH